MKQRVMILYKSSFFKNNYSELSNYESFVGKVCVSRPRERFYKHKPTYNNIGSREIINIIPGLKLMFFFCIKITFISRNYYKEFQNRLRFSVPLYTTAIFKNGVLNWEQTRTVWKFDNLAPRQNKYYGKSVCINKRCIYKRVKRAQYYTRAFKQCYLWMK